MLSSRNLCFGPDRDVLLLVRLSHVIFVPKGMIMVFIADTETLGALVRAERKSQKLTQEQLAGLAGVGVRFVRELEAGKESCQLGRSLQVAQTLGLAVSVSTRREARQ
jgi:y4mF family transcriptional regulator